LRHRIANQTMHPDPNRNAEIREWRLANVARCLAARERLPCTTRVLDSGAQALLQIVGGDKLIIPFC